MACFLVPVTEAIVATAVTKIVKSNEKSPETVKLDMDGVLETRTKTPFSKKLRWLTNMLWGGSALLAFEHLWHGEITPWLPFLSSASSPESAGVMLREMATVGVAMSVLVTAVWGCMLLVSRRLEKKALKKLPAAN